MALSAAQGALAEEPVSVDQGPLLRVLLTRVQAPQLTIALDGSYSMEPGGLTFQRGSKLVIVCAEEGLVLYYEGMAMRASSIALRRHALDPAAAQENGLRFNGEMSIYSGDLTLTASEGTVRPVLAVPMEVYLLGVVPYEMSDSFPLEALKAQAVTARTYAQRKVGASGDYDVVDNTNDQAYKGANASHQRAAQAILETVGLCGYVGKDLARCYYSASNGGQTELMQNVWPDGGKELFTVQDDPYDLQNPRSVVKRALLPTSWPKPGEDSAMDALTERIKLELSEPLAALGYDSDVNYIRVSGIEKAEVHTPQFKEPSRQMTRIKLWVKADARREIIEITPLPTDTPKPTPTADPALDTPEPAAPTPVEVPLPKWTAVSAVPQSIEIDLPLFPDIEQAFGLSINGNDNELITVSEQSDGFWLEARRFGHGVGMSQRGAEWMAATEQWTFEQILKFYYPKIELRVAKHAEQATLPPPVQAEFLITPGPPATPTPRPTLMPLTAVPQEGQWVGTVIGIAEDSWLNVRTEPSTNGKVRTTLYLAQPLLVLEELEGGWLHVQIDTLEGYVMSQFVQRDGP